MMSDYAGVPVVQDVTCSGTELSFLECPNSTELGPNCQDGSRSVELRCYFDSKSYRHEEGFVAWLVLQNPGFELNCFCDR